MSSTEIVTIVDENNRVTGRATRAEMRAQGLCHRATYILVFNSNDKLFLQKRTTNKDIYPGYFDVAAGGVVLAGESYEVSAQRELKEELGIQGIPLESHFDFYHQDGANRVWGRLFDCRYDGQVVLQEEEIESGDFYAIPVILEMSRHQPFTPDGIYALQRYLRKGN